MPYTYYPDSITSTLYPVTYRNTQSSASSLLVEVYIDGASVGSFHAASGGGTSSATYFDIDVQGFCAANVAPFVRSQSSVFGTLNDFYRSLNIIDCYKQLYLTSYPENISSAGYLVTSTAADTSSASYIIPADFYGTTYSLNQFTQAGSGDMYFLTAMRTPRKMRDTQNAYLSYLTLGIDAAQFIFYNGAGSAVSFPVLDMVHTSADNSMQTFSVGLANILGQTPGGGLVFHEGSFPTNTDNFEYYTVSLGTYDGSYNRESEELEFTVEPDCEDKIELHWFGKHGGAESFVIEGGRTDSTKIGGDIVNITQPWNVQGSPRRNSYDKAILRTDTTSEPETRVQCAVTPEEAAYLLTMFQSPEVYVIQGGEYVAVAIENFTPTQNDNRSPFIELDFTIVYGQKAVGRI